MISAPATGCCSSSIASKASAGGQLEQPSDVNNSKTTGTRTLAPPAGPAEFCECPLWQVSARIKASAEGRRCDRSFIRSTAPHVITYYVFWLSADEMLDCELGEKAASGCLTSVIKLTGYRWSSFAFGRSRRYCSLAWWPPSHRFCEHSVLPRRSRATPVLGRIDRLPSGLEHRLRRTRF